MLVMCKTKRSSKCKRCLFIIIKIGIAQVHLVGQSASSLIANFEQVIKSFLVC